MQIEIIGVEVANKGKYQMANVSYKANGKVEGKNIPSFVHKDVFKTLSQAKQGDIFEVKLAKNDKGHWDWTETTSGGKNTGGSTEVSRASQAVRSTYETPEERAKKQVYIVRQSSISAALEVAKLENPKGVESVSIEAVIKVAKQFEEYVFGIEQVEEAEVA